MSPLPFIPVGACAGCPHRQYCHLPRQQAMDVLGLGRHTICEFYQAHELRLAPPHPPARLPLRERVAILLRARSVLMHALPGRPVRR